MKNIFKMECDKTVEKTCKQKYFIDELKNDEVKYVVTNLTPLL